MATVAKNNKEKEIKNTDNGNEVSIDISNLLKEIKALQEKINSLEKEKEVQEVKEEDFSKEKMINFISLSKGSVLLKGTASRPYEIEGQYSTRAFTETEAKAIVTLMGSYMREGYVYIDDAKFVKEAGLGEAYRNILTPEKLRGLFDNDVNSVINIYQNASEGQKKIIIDLVSEKKANNENIDANILIGLSKLSGIDLLETEEE